MPRIPATHVGAGPDGADIFRPIIVVSIEVAAIGVRVPAIVDSGADNTLVPFELIRPLGIDFATLPPGPGGSRPGGRLDVRPCKGIMRWDAGNAILMTKFLVAEPGKGPDTVLLGRADFFKLYIPRFHWHRDPPVFDLDPVTTGRR